MYIGNQMLIKATIQPKTINTRCKTGPGQREKMSHWDAVRVNKHYNCPRKPR